MMRLGFSFAVLASAHLAVATPSPEATQLYRDGKTAYDQARYDDALAAWQRSYELSQAPKLFFNIAQAFRLRAHPGDCARARTQYQRFIELTARSPERDLAEDYVGALATCATVATVATVAPPTHDDSIRKRQIAVATLGAGGLVLLATGVYFSHHASILGDEVARACTVTSPCDWSMESGKDATGHHDTMLGWTFDTFGVLALAGGAALYWFGIRESEVQVTPVATQPHSAGAVMSWRYTW